MIVCICNRVTDRQIREAAEFGVTTLDELKESFGVASCCGKCAQCACAILEEHKVEVAALAA